MYNFPCLAAIYKNKTVFHLHKKNTEIAYLHNIHSLLYIPHHYCVAQSSYTNAMLETCLALNTRTTIVFYSVVWEGARKEIISSQDLQSWKLKNRVTLTWTQ